ncbi:MAG TPA: 7-carboxy-7-deazaguanine synthase QueE [Phycisphaerales bacterium]|nr:7-carboxy-7-deazaguanine synthase QueE [Phycisphaerales bacterium]
MSTPSPLPILDSHDATPDTLPVSETFVSIQGEGKLVGVPSWFLRTSGCNLRCTWCDTPYASWKPEGTRRSVTDLLAEARVSNVRHAVLTGGEPMLFAALAPLTRGLHDAGVHVTIETAGTLAPAPLPHADLWSISPKLAHSTPRSDPRDPTGAWAARHEQRRLNIAALQALLDAPGETQLKFVVAGAGDLPEIDGVLAGLTGWASADILLMPEGVSPPTAAQRKAVADLCLARGFRYCHRLHIDLFGNTRGT